MIDARIARQAPLAVMAGDLGSGRPVVWLTEMATPVVDELLSRAELKVFARAEAAVETRVTPAVWRGLDSIETALGEAEVVVLDDVDLLGSGKADALEALCRQSRATWIVAGVRHRRHAWVEALRDCFAHVHVFELSEFEGLAVCEDAESDVLVDESLVQQSPRLCGHIAVASAQPLELDRYLLVRVDTPKPDAETTDAAADEYAQLEAHLLERGHRVAELERELQRQQALIRDMVERERALTERADSTPRGVQLQDESATLRLQLAQAQERCRILEKSGQAKDALVTRLQLELLEREQSSATYDDRLRELQAENESLRDAVIAAATAQPAPAPALLSSLPPPPPPATIGSRSFLNRAALLQGLREIETATTENAVRERAAVLVRLLEPSEERPA